MKLTCRMINHILKIHKGFTLTVKEIYKDYGIFRHSIQNNITLSYSPKLKHPTVNTITNYPNLLFNESLKLNGSELSCHLMYPIYAEGVIVKNFASIGTYSLP